MAVPLLTHDTQIISLKPEKHLFINLINNIFFPNVITDLPAVSDPGITNQKEDVEPDGDFLDILSATTAPSDAPTAAVDSADQDISATHNDPEALTVDKPIPDTPNASGSSISDGPLAAVKTEPKPLQREAPVEAAAAAVAAISSPPRKPGRLAKIKPKPNLLRAR